MVALLGALTAVSAGVLTLAEYKLARQRAAVRAVEAAQVARRARNDALVAAYEAAYTSLSPAERLNVDRRRKAGLN